MEQVEKKPFQERTAYPFIFMVGLTVFFVAILGILFHTSEQKIQAQQVLIYQTQMVNIFADSISTLTHIDKANLISKEHIPRTYATYFKKETQPTVYYRVETPGHFLGYCFDITGSGLWGTMHAFIGTTPDLNHIVNFSIYSQQETPGLGARVSEDWYKKQFANKKLRINDKVMFYTLVPEGATTDSNTVQQITGATITSLSVSKMLQKEMDRIIPLIHPKQQIHSLNK
jgi:Na+-transporting NADH:ubiquinone oxidoreductase subunit C